MDSSLCHLMKRDGDDRESELKDTELPVSGPSHRIGECNYTNCNFTVDHHHCQMCDAGNVEASQTSVPHLDCSASSRRDPQYQILNDTSSALYSALLYGGGGSATTTSAAAADTVDNYAGYSQPDSFLWHPSVSDKMGLCAPQLSPCFAAGNSSRLPLDSHPAPTLCSPLGDLYSKDLVSLPAKSGSTRSDSQPWFYNGQPMQVYKFVEQTCMPQINFVLLDPPPSSDHNKEPVTHTGELMPSPYTSKSDKQFNPYSTHMAPPCDDAVASLFALEMAEENSASKQSHLFENMPAAGGPGCAEMRAKQHRAKTSCDENCCMLMQPEAGIQSTGTGASVRRSLLPFGACPAGAPGDGVPDTTAGPLEHSSSSGSDSEESDIIVEDTGDQLGAIVESEMSIETLKCCLFENVPESISKAGENLTSLAVDVDASKQQTVSENVGCAVCGQHSSSASSASASARLLIQLGPQSPLTSTSHSPVVLKLSQICADPDESALVVCHQLLNISEADIMNDLGGFLCQSCIGLVDAVDNLESQLSCARENILEMFKVVVKSGSGDELRLRRVQNELDASDTNDCSKIGTGIQETCHLSTHHTAIDEAAGVKATPTKQPAENVLDLKRSLGDEAQGESHEQQVLVGGPCSQDETVDVTVPKENGLETISDLFCYLCGCGCGFANRVQLESHLSTHKLSDAAFLCEVCGKSFPFKSQRQIDRHVAQHFLPNSFSCAECNKGLKSSRALKEHAKVHSGDRPFPCPNCDRRFAHRSNMRAHSKICSRQLPFRCDKCKAAFSVSSRLHRHVAHAHGVREHGADNGADNGAGPFKCAQCGRTFAKQSDALAHQRVHSSLRAFSCQVCHRSYKSLSNLNHHAKIHNKDKPFTCEICQQGFLRKTEWESHLYKHKGERPFKCAECPKSFWSKENLSMHSKRHAGLHKKNKCPICEKSFSQKLSVHLRTHTGARPYRCEKCSKTFSTGSSLNKHGLLKHPAPELLECDDSV